MGVNATKELSKTVEWLSSRGCRSVFNLLDMDKIINPYVANAAIKINKLFKKSDMELKSHFWDKETAKSILKKQNKLLEDNKLKVKYPNDDVFYMVLYNTLALKKKNIIVPDELQDWNPATKGFDDFLQNKYAK